jgi:uncharacterized protein YoxC
LWFSKFGKNFQVFRIFLINTFFKFQNSIENIVKTMQKLTPGKKKKKNGGLVQGQLQHTFAE